MNCPVCGNVCAAPITLATETHTASSKSLTYRLLLLTKERRVFAVEIAEENGACETEEVGTELTCAIGVYLKLVKNGVRACHLGDVLHDIVYDPKA